MQNAVVIVGRHGAEESHHRTYLDKDRKEWHYKGRAHFPIFFSLYLNRIMMQTAVVTVGRHGAEESHYSIQHHRTYLDEDRKEGQYKGWAHFPIFFFLYLNRIIVVVVSNSGDEQEVEGAAAWRVEIEQEVGSTII